MVRGTVKEGILSFFPQVILHMPADRKASFSRLLRLGGAEVLALEAPCTDPGPATHCVAEPSRMPEGSLDLGALARGRVPVVKPLFLNKYLTMQRPPKEDDFFVQGFDVYWKNERNS